jgi:hypothetical protein
MVLEVTRAQVMAYRAAAHGLDRRTKAAADLAVLDLGVQSAGESARLAVAARLADVPRGEDDPLTDDETFALLWSFRGAPHLHRRADLPGLVSALWPLNEADAMSRLPAERAALRAADMSALDAFSAVARALRSVVTRPLSKGEVSAAVTARLPEALSYECRPCQAVHVYVGIFQQAGLFAGVRHVPDQSPLTLVPLEGRPRIPTKAAGTTEVLRAYLRLHGPATLTDAAGYLGTTGPTCAPCGRTTPPRCPSTVAAAGSSPTGSTCFATRLPRHTSGCFRRTTLSCRVVTARCSCPIPLGGSRCGGSSAIRAWSSSTARSPAPGERGREDGPRRARSG